MGDATSTTTATETTTGGAPPASIVGGTDAKVEATATTTATATETKTAATETKSAAGESKDAKAETKTDTKPALVDDKWEPKQAEGVKRDAKVVGEARGLFKKLGLTSEQAQALVEFSDAQAKTLADDVKAADDGWLKELQDDKEIGGPKLAATRESVREMLRQLKSGPQLAKWVDQMGIGNAAPLVRVLAELASRTREDTVKSTVVDPAAAAVNEQDRRTAKTYGNNTRKES